MNFVLLLHENSWIKQKKINYVHLVTIMLPNVVNNFQVHPLRCCKNKRSSCIRFQDSILHDDPKH